MYIVNIQLERMLILTSIEQFEDFAIHLRHALLDYDRIKDFKINANIVDQVIRKISIVNVRRFVNEHF